MKSGITVGFIAGIVIGIVHAAYGFALAYIGIIEPPGGWGVWDASLMRLFTLAVLSLGVIWGTIFGAIYAQIIDRVPGTGVLKGLYFGLIVWLIKDVAAGSYIALILMEVNSAISLILVGFLMWMIYGLILGILYKNQLSD